MDNSRFMGLQNDTLNHLTFCYDPMCVNETLIIVATNHVKFKDVHGNLIFLTRAGYPSNIAHVDFANDLLSKDNHNDTVLPGVDFPEHYIDLSNTSGARPSVTAINDIYYSQKMGSLER